VQIKDLAVSKKSSIFDLKYR